MEQCQIVLNYNGVNTTMQCRKDEKLKDIFKNFIFKTSAEDKILIYMYNGNTIQNEELTFNEIANSEDKERNEMNILVVEGLDHPAPHTQDHIIKSKNIICPECKEDIKIKIEDYVINLYECKNKHDIDNIFLNEFDSTQNLDISKIICQNCGKYNKLNVHNNIFYKCNSCKKDLCPICYSNHDKNHNIINYDDKNYICEQHNKLYLAYCDNCKQNICLYCEQDHKEHNIINYGKIFPNENEINNKLKELEEAKDKFQNDIDGIIIKLNKIKNNFEIYYNIFKNIINNFNKEKINYEILYNIDYINNTEIINNINNIVNDNNIKNKFNKLINIYNKMNSYNAISIVYTINKKVNDMRIFGEEFVKNNINNCSMVIDNTEYKIYEKLKTNNYDKDIINVKLKGINRITNMSYMFSWCSSLSSIPDISKWDTSNVNNMSYIFSCCRSLSSLPDISKWNTSNVNDMSYMFYDCYSLSSIPDISKWNTSNVNDMSYMFSNCKSLSSLPDISEWNTSNVRNMSYLFYDCNSLQLLPDISEWNTSKVKNMSYMFSLCSSISSLPDISKWDTSHLENKENMFEGCSKLVDKPAIHKKKKGFIKNIFW